MSETPAAQYEILYVDDEVKALRYFTEMFSDSYTVHTAANAMDGYRILQERGGQIGVLVTDQRMPGASGVELMEHARKLNPHLVRILVTAYTDYQTAVDAVNEGRAFRYLHKPWNPEELEAVLKHAMDFYSAQVERERLLAEKAETIRHMLTSDKVSGMGILAEGLNHHLRNALTVVRAFIDLAPMKLMDELGGRMPRDPAFWTDVQTQAQGQIERIQSLLMKLAEASYARQLTRQDKLSLGDVLSDTLQVFSAQLLDKGIRVDVEIDPQLPPLFVHSDRFRQMWRLIFIEELTHLNNGDSLAISATTVRDSLGVTHAIMKIRDNAHWQGVGTAANLFDPFYVRSRKPDDFGVNMMACFVTMHLHGGNITAERLEPKGMELTIDLPLDPYMPKSTPSDDFFVRVMHNQEKWRNLEHQPAA